MVEKQRGDFMLTELLLIRNIKNSILNKSLDKEQIYKEIKYKIKGKETNPYKLEKFYKYALYKKYENNTVIESKIGDSFALKPEDIEGYRKLLSEEEYVVRIIKEKYNKNTSISDWKMNLHLLKGNYADLTKDDNIDIEAVNSYITGYAFIENVKSNFKKRDKRETSSFSTYSPEKAVEYAITYAFNYNTEKYPSYAGKGGDCANFVSQALHAGGKPMVGTNAANFNNWFCRSNNSWDVSKISSTWRGADAFSHYWRLKAVSYKDFDNSYFRDDTEFKKVLAYAYRGDPVSILNSNGRPFHTMIIIDYGKEDLICAAHSRDTISASLRYYGTFSGGVRIYKMG